MSATNLLLDDFALRSLVIRERYLKDTQQWEKWRESYHPDTSKTWIDIAWISGDIDKFVAESITMTGRITSTHFIQPVDVNIQGDKGLTTSYGHIVLRFSENEQEYDMISWGWWMHRAVRMTDTPEPQWKLVALRFIYDRDSISPTKPAQSESLDISLAPGARASYKYLEWTLSRRGYKISRDLPGSDLPASVERLRAQEDQWLQH